MVSYMNITSSLFNHAQRSKALDIKHGPAKGTKNSTQTPFSLSHVDNHSIPLHQNKHTWQKFIFVICRKVFLFVENYNERVTLTYIGWGLDDVGSCCAGRILAVVTVGPFQSYSACVGKFELYFLNLRIRIQKERILEGATVYQLTPSHAAFSNYVFPFCPWLPTLEQDNKRKSRIQLQFFSFIHYFLKKFHFQLFFCEKKERKVYNFTMEPTSGKPSSLHNLLIRFLLFGVLVIEVCFAYLITIANESYTIGDFCFFSVEDSQPCHH